MQLGFRARLFLLSTALLAVMGLVSGLSLDVRLKAAFEAQVQADLEARARLVVAHVETLPGLTPEQADPVADRLGEAAGVRVSIIRADGRVLGDSEIALDRLPELDDHSRRPEVLAARRDGVGLARRFSRSTGEVLLYVAVPFGDVDGGTVRVARRLLAHERDQAELQALIPISIALGLGVSGVLTLIFGTLASRRLAGVLERARAAGAVAGTSLGVGGLATAFDKLALAVEESMAELAHERDRTRAVLESMAEGVLAVEPSGRIVLMNRAARRVLGIGGARPQLLVEATRAPALDQLVREALAGDGGQVELVLLPDPGLDGPGGPGLTALVTATPLGRSGCVLVLRDVTELRRLERVRRDFVANVSHELRTPVAAVQASVDALDAGAMGDPEHASQFLDAIRRNNARLGSLIADLLSLSQIEAGKLELRLVDLQLDTVLDEVRDALSARLAERPELALDLQGLSLRADHAALRQILQNYLANALTYTPPGTPLAVRSRQDGDRVRVEVVDEGPGITSEQRERVFERFYRVDAGRSRAAGGTGLGLAIVRHLAELMHGTVGVDANVPRGCVFWVDLPAGLPRHGIDTSPPASGPARG